ncbi:MAG: hypothetical protein JWM60_1678 [Solirubrobacterales bacterium]|nr:hypothetical protein [Solirubrobacterales bacterium]
MEVSSTTATRPSRWRDSSLGSRSAGEVLGSWQPAEIRIARGFLECRGLSTEQLEDLYQETVLALLARPYGNEEHLRNALRRGIRHRALNLHRDTRRRGQILAEHAPSMHQMAESSAETMSPESMALRGEDRQVVLEFLGELDPFEQRVFELTAEGLRYRAIARRLGVDVNEARRAARTVERKRAHFRLRHAQGWQPHPQARSVQLLAAPVPMLAAGFAATRRWLFGTGLSAKAGAAAASIALFGAGAAGIVGSSPGAHPAGSASSRRATRPVPPNRRTGAWSQRRKRAAALALAKPRRVEEHSAGRAPAAPRPRTGIASSLRSASAQQEFGIEGAR